MQSDYSKFGLPAYFTKMAIALIILPVVFMGITKWMYGSVTEQFGEYQVSVMTEIISGLIIIGLAFIAFSRTKLQDEATVRRRLAGMFGSFVTAIIIVIISPIFDLIVGTETDVYDGKQLVILMLILNIVYRYPFKTGAQKQ